MATKIYGEISVTIPDFTPEEIKELRELVGRSEGLSKPMGAFNFAVRFDFNYHSLTSWEQGRRSPSVLHRFALAAIKEQALEKIKQTELSEVTPPSPNR